MRAAAVAGAASVDEVLAAVRAQAGMEGRALVAGVSTSGRYEVGAGSTPVAVLDYGCKRLDHPPAEAAGARVTVWPHDTDAATILAARPAGVLLSNGPGDPVCASRRRSRSSASCSAASRSSASASATSCSALAAGLETFKLPFGHRGANHPVLELESSRVLVTSQNHGFAVRGDGPGGHARLALRRHGRGPRARERARTVAPVPSGGGPRPARRLAGDRGLGRGDQVCPGGLTSSPSA